MAKRKQGRPTAYTKKIADEICLRLSVGESLRSICRDDYMPVLSTVLLWVIKDREGFSAQYAQAREAQSHTLHDEMLDYRHGILDGTIEPNAAKVCADIIKWTAERMARRSFHIKDIEPQQSSQMTVTIIDATAPDEMEEQ